MVCLKCVCDFLLYYVCVKLRYLTGWMFKDQGHTTVYLHPLTPATSSPSTFFFLPKANLQCCCLAGLGRRTSLSGLRRHQSPLVLTLYTLASWHIGVITKARYLRLLKGCQLLLPHRTRAQPEPADQKPASASRICETPLQLLPVIIMPPA